MPPSKRYQNYPEPKTPLSKASHGPSSITPSVLTESRPKSISARRTSYGAIWERRPRKPGPSIPKTPGGRCTITRATFWSRCRNLHPPWANPVRCILLHTPSNSRKPLPVARRTSRTITSLGSPCNRPIAQLRRTPRCTRTRALPTMERPFPPPRRHSLRGRLLNLAQTLLLLRKRDQRLGSPPRQPPSRHLARPLSTWLRSPCFRLWPRQALRDCPRPRRHAQPTRAIDRYLMVQTRGSEPRLQRMPPLDII
jgi:hypothetical protein